MSRKTQAPQAAAFDAPRVAASHPEPSRRKLLFARARRLAREHPITFVAAAAAAAVLIEEELALGALLGVAATTLVTVRTGRDVRGQLRAKGRDLLDRTRATLEHHREHEASHVAPAAKSLNRRAQGPRERARAAEPRRRAHSPS